MNKIRVAASILCPIMAVILLVGEIIYSNELICGTEELTKIESTIATLENENQTLALEIAELSSLETIGKKAVAMGFTLSQKVLTLNPDSATVAFQFK